MMNATADGSDHSPASSFADNPITEMMHRAERRALTTTEDGQEIGRQRGVAEQLEQPDVDHRVGQAALTNSTATTIPSTIAASAEPRPGRPGRSP